MIDYPELVRRANEYCRRVGKGLGPQIGSGYHGNVFTLENQSNTYRSAIKVHERERFYRRERNIYMRLAEEGVTSVLGCTVPEMLRHDDELLVIEMTVVTPPYVLDFAGAYLDEEPDFSDEVMAEAQQRWADLFEKDWAKVQAIVRQFEQYGIILADLKPANICLRT